MRSISVCSCLCLWEGEPLLTTLNLCACPFSSDTLFVAMRSLRRETGRRECIFVSWNVSNPNVTSSHGVISLNCSSCAFLATSIIPSINAMHASVLFSASCANVCVQTKITCMVLTQVRSISAGAYDIDATVIFAFDI